MEYKRIHGVQTGVISPSKLRMKLLGVHSHWRNDGGTPSSTATGGMTAGPPEPPSKLEELEHSKGILPGRSLPEEGGGGGGSGNGYDSGHESGGAATGFEFHGGERPLVVGPFQRPIPSKWNDAEKWIIGRQPAHPNLIKKTLMQQRYGGGQPLAGNLGKVAPEGVDPLVADSKRVDLTPGVKSVSMRDMGTEMTPWRARSHRGLGPRMGHRHRVAAPSAHSLRPPGGARAPVVAPPIEVCSEKVLDARDDGRRAELSEKEPGKMNIAAWASKGDVDNEGGGRAPCEGAHQAQLKRVDFESRAAVWEEAEKTKHTARFKREEAKIQVWESHEKAKIEAEMREVEALRDQAAVREKLATAEARRERQVAATCCQAEHIRRTGQPPPPPGCRRLCCLWFS
ncbi:unnamed protein product [Spirodela intermedia]|uniref:Remorin C-terminal domain-containing protein n=1 Tax=Spirodela intermedia TaxID=51605 RepID=A0A7I8JEX7_SPIIN|nr:unnamed protein product [Spirodela intermedia]CAA6668093.1 unnamed protein product [Spirodela intermedia]